MNTDKPRGPVQLPGAIWLAVWFHNTYERLAPQYGYDTRHETRVFDASSPNGKLMIAVCRELREQLSNATLDSPASPVKDPLDPRR